MKTLPTKPKTIPPIDDRVRKDGGKPTDDKVVPPEQIAKIKEAAREHNREEPGS